MQENNLEVNCDNQQKFSQRLLSLFVAATLQEWFQ